MDFRAQKEWECSGNYKVFIFHFPLTDFVIETFVDLPFEGVNEM